MRDLILPQWFVYPSLLEEIIENAKAITAKDLDDWAAAPADLARLINDAEHNYIALMGDLPPAKEAE